MKNFFYEINKNYNKINFFDFSNNFINFFLIILHYGNSATKYVNSSK
jgi:hypothetical protein